MLGAGHAGGSAVASQRNAEHTAKSIECCHGGSRGKQKKQRTGTSSSSVIAESRTRALPVVRLAASIPAAERSFLRSVRASWPDTLFLCQRMLEEQLSQHPSVVCRGRDQCSPQRGRMPRGNPCSVDVGETVLLHAFASPSHGTTGSRLPLAADIVHTCAWPRQITLPLIVRSSGPRNRRSVRAWNTTDVTLFSHFQMHLHAEAPQCRMHGSTEICLLRVPRIRRVVGRRVQTPRRGLIPRNRKQTFSPPNNSVSIPHIQCGISDGATVHRAFGWASWMIRLHSNQWNKDPTRSVWQECPMRRACGDIHSCSVQSASSAAAGTPIGAIHSSLAWRCDQCDSSVLPSTSSPCSSMPAMSSQSWCSLAAIAAFVKRTTTHTGNIPHHAAACHVRAGEPDSISQQARGDAGGDASVK
ncbi:hypothetical protein TCDM_10781 [Trypanosoma cruzi Dm28c]|uniref:Uncharacterized protein n=1 Tax=Trypanosoma cruzi Dm28c TaxID=1416333 RepID=V5BB65_TRYCR|nr:hypothetical protein TCDM_10781 [Trypanosoma cruzi Dm28c]